jgi:isoamylase
LVYAQEKTVLDPYSKCIFNTRRSFGELAAENGDADQHFRKTWPQAAAIIPSSNDEFDWEGDKPLERPMEELIIYEAHVRGFTAHKNSGVDHPGTCN